MSQSDLLLSLLKDFRWRRTDEILEKVYGDNHLGIARIGARIADLKGRGAKIEGKKDLEKPTLYWYRLITGPKAPLEEIKPKEPSKYETKPKQPLLFDISQNPWD